VKISLRGAAIAASAAGILSLGAMPAAAGDVSKQYVGPAGDAALAGFGATSKDCGATDPGVNGACALFSGGEFDVAISDATGQKINAVVSFKDGAAAAMSTVIPICGTAHITNAPEGAASIWVRVTAVGRTGGVSISDPTNPTPPAATLPCGVPTAPTTGTIKFSGPGVGSTASSYSSVRTSGRASSAEMAGAPAEQASQKYLAPGYGDVVGIQCVGGAPYGLGGGCFTLSGGGSLTVSLTDDHQPKVGGTITFQTDGSATGKAVGDTTDFCGSATVSVPDGAGIMFVQVGSVGLDSKLPPGLDCGSPQGATTGTVNVDGAAVGASSGKSLAAYAALRAARSTRAL
jgi:hypothetical protein